MKPYLTALFLVMISLPTLAADKPANLDELLEQVKKESVIEQQQNAQREAVFAAAQDEQAALLAQAKQELADAQAQTIQLNEQFKAFEQQLAEQQALLDERSGTLGELFGTVRQIANDSRAVIESSMASAPQPDRAQILTKLSESQQQPTIEELRQLWLTIQDEMTASGKVETFTAPVITASGEIQDKVVTRIGVFTAISEGMFLRYLPETGNLVELARQPANRYRQLAEDYVAAEKGDWLPTVIDPTRGAIMALLVQTPTLKERIEQGGWIGYIILILGVVGLLIALVQFVFLSTTSRGVIQQQKRTEVSVKNPLGRILSVYNDKLAQDVETLSLKLDEAILRETPKLERGLITLAVLAAITPMLGLLGTVSGMIETFQSITLFGTGDPKLMSGGISQALVTTELGLAVAIPLLLIHSGLSGKSNRLIQILDEESAALVARNAEQHNEQLQR